MRRDRFLLFLCFFEILLTTKIVYAAQECRQLFDLSQNELPNLKRENDVNSEKRQTSSWVVQDDYGQRKIELPKVFMPPGQKLVVYEKNGLGYLLRESVVEVGPQKKLRLDQVPLDKNLGNTVIDAGLESGRKLLEDILNVDPAVPNEAQGVFIFIDVNDLGYMNRHFFHRQKAGDAYIKGVSEILLKIAKSEGLVFRLGGDEFGLVLPPMKADAIKNLQTQIMTKLRQEVHQIYQHETIVRAENIRLLKKYLEMQIIDEATYQLEIKQFEAYAPYSQEGLSIGASYIMGQGAQAIFKDAETQANRMKVVVKTRRKQNTAKYEKDFSSELLSQPQSSQFNLPYEFPLLSDEGLTFKTEPTQSESHELLELMQQKRGDVVRRFGPVSLTHYISEDQKVETRIEYFTQTQNEQKTPERLIKSVKVDLHSHSNFIDGKSDQTKELIQFFLSRYPKNRGLIWINLLDLGKLNYFKDKTATGDRMIKRFSELITESIRDSDIPIKLPGSEFAILVDAVGEYKLQKMAERLTEVIQKDAEIQQIFREQIDFLKAQLESETDSFKRQQLRLKLSEVIALRKKPKSLVRSLFIENNLDQRFDQLLEQIKHDPK